MHDDLREKQGEEKIWQLCSIGGVILMNRICYPGLLDPILFIGGGIVGGFAGVGVARVLERHQRALNVLFACVIFAVAAYMLVGTGPVT